MVEEQGGDTSAVRRFTIVITAVAMLLVIATAVTAVFHKLAIFAMALGAAALVLPLFRRRDGAGDVRLGLLALAVYAVLLAASLAILAYALRH
jgi:heme/copper-type cytochrome/quinol oxidase subunit 4